MSKLNNQSQSLYNIEFVQDISHETASAISGGGVADVVLYSKENFNGDVLEVNQAVSDLEMMNFGEITSSIRVNNNQTWRFYDQENFMGEYIDIGPGESLAKLGEFDNEIESLQAIT
jgi:hypothetical protein